MGWAKGWKRKSVAAPKYGNQKQTCSVGHSHASKLEGAVCAVLQLRERAGEIKILQVQDHIYLTDARILYVPDFRCVDLATNEVFHVEAKGYEDQKWPIKKKLWKFYGPGRLEVWRGTHQRPTLDETIIPVTKKE